MEGCWGEGEWGSGLRSAWGKRNMKQEGPDRKSRALNSGRGEEQQGVSG